MDGLAALPVLEPLAMDRVRQLHGQLTSVVGSLNDKVSAVLKKQESEFLRAYRAHMYSVQKELAQLRAKADDAALQLAKNEKIRQLEAERDWYRSEALRLDAFCSSLKSDVEYMRDKLAAVEDDRAWLERQLKTTKRSASLADGMPGAPLSASRGGGGGRPGGGGGGRGDDIESDDEDGDLGPHGSAFDAGMAAATGGSATAGASSGGGAGGVGPRVSRRVPLAPGPVPAAVAALGRAMAGEAPPPAGALYGASVTGGGGAGAGVGGAGGSAAAAQARQLQNQLAAAQRLVESLRSRNTRLKAANTALRSSRGELETFFLQCVEDVRREVARRRVRAVASTPAATGATLPALSTGPLSASAASMAEAALTNSHSVDLAVALARAKQATLADFTATDRRAVVARLLQDEAVLNALHGVLFAAADMPPLPEDDDGGGGGGGGMGAGMGAGMGGGMGASSPSKSSLMLSPGSTSPPPYSDAMAGTSSPGLVRARPPLGLRGAPAQMSPRSAAAAGASAGAAAGW